MSAEQPIKLGEYVLLEKLGQGGMATVYRGERVGEAGFKKTVAIKRMLPQFRRSASLLERFAAEARTNARLDHPNLVSVADFGIAPEPYLVMEYIDGVNLAALLQRLVKMGEPLELAAACFIGAEAAQGLDHAHRKRDEAGNPLGIVHRDVSPQNVMLSSEGAVKVSDFGLVKAADNVVQTGSGVPIGKLSYMAPEQANHEEVDARADVFSLGIVIWEMLAMRVLVPPNDPGRAAVMMQACDFPPPSKYRPEVPEELDAIVMGCLTKSPTDRTPSAQAVGMTLREVLHGIAPGYGRDQLARLLGWVFPERGWQIDEPHAPPKQPSAEERLSIPPAPAMRPSMPEQAQTHVDVRRADPMVTGPHAPLPSAAPVMAPGGPAPATKSSRVLWLAIGAGVLAVLGVLGLAALVLVYTTIATEDRQSEVPPMPEAPRRPAIASSAPPQPGAMAPNGPGVSVEADALGATLYRGPNLVGRLPVFLEPSDFRGPLVVVAPGRVPQRVDVQQLRDHAATGRPVRLVLGRARRPPQAIYINYQGTATAWAGGVQVGVAPGLLMVPRTPLGGVPAIVMRDGALVRALGTQHCTPATVCLLEGGAP